MIYFTLQPSHIRKKLPCQQYSPESTAYFQIPLLINRPSLLFLCRTDIPYLPEIYDIIDLFINKSFFLNLIRVSGGNQVIELIG